MNAQHEAPFAQTGLVLQPPLDGMPGEVELVAFAPGPAGTSSSRVHSDVTVDVDFAEPDRLCSLDADDVGASRSLEQLIGPTAFRAVRKSLLIDSDRSRRVTTTGADPLTTARRRPRGSFEPESAVRQFAFSLAARAVGDDPYEPALVRAVAYLEAAALLVGTPWVGHMDRGGLEEQIVFAAETLLQDVAGEQMLAELDLRGYERLREAVLQVAHQPSWSGRPWAADLIARFPQRLFDLAGFRDRRQEAHVLGDMEALPMRRFSDSIMRPTAPSPSLEQIGPGRYVYRFSSTPGGSWLRLTEPRSQALVALAPIRKERRNWEAHVVVPTALSIASVIVETTDSPIVGSPSSVDTMLEAIDHGRAATRLSAAGEPAASQRWRLCARVWEQLGDTTRARRAMAYSTGREQVTRPDFVHERLRDSSH